MAGLAVAAGPAPAQATAVQLPTYSFFSVDTTVSVPDSGSGFLGGMSQGQDSQNQFGFPLPLFGDRSIGSSRTAAGARVTATIHDFEAVDAALLGEPASSFAEHHRRAEAGADSQGRSPAALAGNWAPKARQETASEAAAAVAAEAARRVALRQARADEAQKFFDRARQAETDGKPKVARIYYQMAARRASGELKQQALARLQAIGSASATKVVETRP
jgi:hypothetical protein